VLPLLEEIRLAQQEIDEKKDKENQEKEREK
jgi:hypothetical protein